MEPDRERRNCSRLTIISSCTCVSNEEQTNVEIGGLLWYSNLTSRQDEQAVLE